MIKIIPPMSRLSIRNVSKSYFSRKKSLLALSSANLDIAGGNKEGLLIKKGKIIEKLPQDMMVSRLKAEILAFAKQHAS